MRQVPEVGYSLRSLSLPPGLPNPFVHHSGGQPSGRFLRTYEYRS